jgi:hypothetical protein
MSYNEELLDGVIHNYHLSCCVTAKGWMDLYHLLTTFVFGNLMSLEHISMFQY